MVERVSPSLVEAAARAIRDPIMLFLEREFCMIATVESDKLADLLAPLALAAVGDALRLEGAQAERERAVEAVEVRRMDAFITENPFDYGYNQALDDVLAALGGVHPGGVDVH